MGHLWTPVVFEVQCDKELNNWFQRVILIYASLKKSYDNIFRVGFSRASLHFNLADAKHLFTRSSISQKEIFHLMYRYNHVGRCKVK